MSNTRYADLLTIHLPQRGQDESQSDDQRDQLSRGCDFVHILDMVPLQREFNGRDGPDDNGEAEAAAKTTQSVRSV